MMLSNYKLNTIFHENDSCIAVVGDVMIDKYIWGKVTRISPEAPVPVIDYVKESFHLGGAANVAANLVSLGVNSLLCGVVGNDADGELFRYKATEEHIDTRGIITEDTRITTVKTRIMGNKRHIARIDREQKNDILQKTRDSIFEKISTAKNLRGIIIEDYNKGVVSKEMIREILKFAKNKKIPVFVDPKHDNFFEFKGVTVFKPNLVEASKALDKSLETKTQIADACKELVKKTMAENILITLGSNGMMLFEREGNKFTHIPTIARNVSDVSGAGDTAIATLAFAMAMGATAPEAAEVANIAAGIVCEEPGVVSVKKEQIINYFK